MRAAAAIDYTVELARLREEQGLPAETPAHILAAAAAILAAADTCPKKK